MPYTPSLDDLPLAPAGTTANATQGYTPSIDDLPAENVPQTSALDWTAQNIAAPINAGAMQFGGNLLSDIGRLTGNQPFAQQMNQLVQNAPQITGAPQSATSQLLQNVSQFAPYSLIGGGGGISQALGLRSLPYVGNLLFNPIMTGGALSGAAYGATQSAPGQAGNNALKDAGLGYAVSTIPAAGIGGFNLLTGRTFQNAANDAFQNISQGMSKDDLNSNIVSNLVDSYNKFKSDFGQAYDQFGNAVAGHGYATSGSLPIPGLGDPTASGKFINLSNDTLNTLAKILTKANVDAGDAKIPQDLSNLINNAQNSPTYLNLHNLQSKLGEAAADYSSGNAGQTDLQISKLLSGARNNIKSDIINTFINNGDTNLANRYAQLSQGYRENVIPYQESAPIWRAINGGEYPRNISNVLSNQDEEGNYDAIRNHIASNPQLSGQVVAQALAKYAPKDFDGTSVVNFNKLQNAYANLPQPIQQLTPDDFATQIAKLNKYNSYLGKAQYALSGGAVGAGATYLGHKILEK